MNDTNHGIDKPTNLMQDLMWCVIFYNYTIVRKCLNFLGVPR